MRFSFKKDDRILKRSEFLDLTRSGRKLQNDCFIAFFKPGRFDSPRLGITVTRKVGNAAQRNRIKRLVREYFRLNRQHLNQNWDINIVAKKKAADLSSEKVDLFLQDLFEKISNCVD
jgi:ribonuclease P protein component